MKCLQWKRNKVGLVLIELKALKSDSLKFILKSLIREKNNKYRKILRNFDI